MIDLDAALNLSARCRKQSRDDMIHLTHDDRTQLLDAFDAALCELRELRMTALGQVLVSEVARSRMQDAFCDVIRESLVGTAGQPFDTQAVQATAALERYNLARPAPHHYLIEPADGEAVERVEIVCAVCFEPSLSSPCPRCNQYDLHPDVRDGIAPQPEQWARHG